nr:MAG TPA: hypothetical protein [Caudoviricetes sp.]
MTPKLDRTNSQNSLIIVLPPNLAGNLHSGELMDSHASVQWEWASHIRYIGDQLRQLRPLHHRSIRYLNVGLACFVRGFLLAHLIGLIHLPLGLFFTNLAIGGVMHGNLSQGFGGILSAGFD